jgi:uncharacterized membrane protein YeiB
VPTSVPFVLHVCVVFVPLRWAFPDEDWPVQVGVLAFVGDVVVALQLGTMWFRRFSRGPLEGAWAMASGSVGPHVDKVDDGKAL